MKLGMGALRRRARQAFDRYAVSRAGALLESEGHGGRVREELAHRGFDVVPRGCYSPIPDPADLADGAFWRTSSELVGVRIDDEACLSFADRVVRPYLREFRDSFGIDGPKEPNAFYVINGSYMAVDAHVYYGVIRHYRPRLVLEVGAGNSTLLAAAALSAQVKTGSPGRLVAVDPFPPPSVRTVGAEVVASRVQDVGRDLAASLDDRDVLFIDSSHVVRLGGDVVELYLEILPRLRPGVLVHVHDISLPRAYPKSYYEGELFWTEQFLLQAFLAFNDRVEILWPGNYLMLRHPERMIELFPEMAEMRARFPMSEPTAFWFRVRGGSPE